MFILRNRITHKNCPYYIKRGLSTDCNKCQSNIKKTIDNLPLWSSQFRTKSEEDSKQPEADDKFIGSLFTDQAWLSKRIEWLEDLPTVEAINMKMVELYPQFATQFADLRKGYEKMWEYLTMEEFRKIVDEINKDAKDPSKFPELSKDAVVREGSGLSEQELLFIKKRKQFQKQSFAQLIGEDVDNIDERDIPIVGLASSGGGYRAMIGLTGYLNAMKESGILDCTMYFAGISGSCWTMALYYNQLTQSSPQKLKYHLKSHVNTHWANVSNFINILTSSPENSKLLMQGAIQRFYQQNGDISLVDIFGVLLGQTLLTKKRDSLPSEKSGQDITSISEESEVGEFEHRDLYLTGQAHYIKGGLEPMPIYSVVRHDITLGKTFEDRMEEIKRKLDVATKPTEIADLETEKKEIENQQKDGYQWFEFTPYDVGCEEMEAWVPTWSFGRKFLEGKNLERLPEQTLDILIGMFGSAFAASLVHFYKEIRSLLPAGSLDKIDETIIRYEASMSSYHPISPSSFANPFYGLSKTFTMDDGKVIERPETIVGSKELYLMDAGMDNNIPFYPLLRKGRDVDIILAVDLSADIQTSTHFDRAESYIKKRKISGWPTGAGWPKNNSDEKYPLGSCTIFEAETEEEVKTQSNSKSLRKERPITLVYFPFIVNKTFDPDFDPQEAEFCKTWNFVYTPEQVEKVAGLAEANWTDNLEKIKSILKKTWERKRNERLEGESVSIKKNVTCKV